MDFLSNYMRLSREERTEHIDLSSPCDFTQSPLTRRKKVRHFLLVKHELVNDVLDWQEGKHINVCHCCCGNSSNGYCANPDHAYLGTHSENQSDKSLEARQAGGRASPGRDFTFEERSVAGKKGGRVTSSRWSICALDGILIKSCAISAYIKKRLNINRYEHTGGAMQRYSVMLSKQQYDDVKDLDPLQRLLALGME